jgi:hypothetical protein
MKAHGSLLRQPSGWLPVAMSAAALLLVAQYVLLAGGVREADEGAAAHLWQLLMAGQIPIELYFAVKWLPRLPGPALRVLALQAALALASFAAVYFLQL